MFDLRLAAKNLTMTVELAPNIPEYIISDENKIKEILINLLGNAVKFTSKGGVALRCRTEKDPLNTDPKSLLLFIDVEDTGIGISAEDMPRLFKAFEQTRSGAQMIGGTGLGLAISQSHARLLGGNITISSTVGVGSCFQVKLAVQQSENVELGFDLPRRQVVGVKPGTKEIRVLIADDHEENRLVIRELLEPLGILTQTTENGKIALETALSWKPDLILMDLRMPILNGFEAAKKIKSTIEGKNIQIVAVTASILELDKHKVNESGMTGYLRKPFKDYELFSILESKLGSIFTYSDPISPAKDTAELDTTTMTPESMAVIPQELLDQMAIATTKAHFQMLVALIDKVSAFSPQIASHLRKLANSYQYDSLLELFGKSGDDGD